MLDLSTLEKAVNRLEINLGLAHSPLAQTGTDIYQALRAAAIQAFEYSYELAIKFMYRVLEEEYGMDVPADDVPFRDMLRLLYERHLIDSDDAWLAFRVKRNMTSHTYDEGSAKEVYEAIPFFLEEARRFLNRVKERQGTKS